MQATAAHPMMDVRVPYSPSLWMKVGVLFFVIAPFFATLYGVWQLWNWWITWQDIAMLVGMYYFYAIGITVGAHRGFAHYSFRPKPVVWYGLAIVFFGSVMGRLTEWVATHRFHHAHSDDPLDPHSPHHMGSLLRGLIHAHIGWLWRDKTAPVDEFAKDLLKDRGIMFLEKLTPLWVALSVFVIPYLIGGWSGILWGGLIRTFFIFHITWSVNSVCHTFGKKQFKTDDESRNVSLFGILRLLTVGESGHENHHLKPRSAAHWFGWKRFTDLSYLVILFLASVSLVDDVFLPKKEEIEKFRLDAVAA
jgi:stearoyl-CoA desaturase (Delta-9 desaturase)